MDTSQQRIRLDLRGAVQGVGFRPFVYRLARQLRLAGFVRNTSTGADIEIEGPASALRQFLDCLERQRPPQCQVERQTRVDLPATGESDFFIQPSDETGSKKAQILPDLATCFDCLREIFDTSDRRYRYPFTNCTNCGPRFSIIEAIPYDRPNTTMQSFALCDRCRAEYENPCDRRFHAQPNACPMCGPHVELWDAAGNILAQHDSALHAAADAIRRGAIVAVKGLGGFHLLVDARDDGAVLRLRQRKARDEKPFAVMFQSFACVQKHCEIPAVERGWLTSVAAPIVLLRRSVTPVGPGAIAPSVAPGNPFLGAMLPYSPLHHVLLADLGFPVVATSGNLSDEPICIDERDALQRLRNIADVLLVHNRPIARAMEDSVMQVVLDKEQVLRAGRGLAPLTVPLSDSMPPALAVGGHLKNTIAIAVHDRAIISQHVGDLETVHARVAFQQSLHDLPRLYDLQPASVVCDLHPDYASTQAAESFKLPLWRVQHHEAHLSACMAEHELTGKFLGVAWDGTGYGTDGSIWGGEFLSIDETSCRRVAHFRPFRLPGGDKAMREPRRAALGVLFELFGDKAFEQTHLPTIVSFSPHEKTMLAAAMRRQVNTPPTSSAGRLFDAVASLCGLRQVSSFEGQAGMDVQYAAGVVNVGDRYSCIVHADGMIDWAPMFLGILNDLGRGVAVGQIAARFHSALAQVIVEAARCAGRQTVVFGGGCFQNQLLLESAVRGLHAAGFKAYWPQRVPPGDGGLALGQLAAWAAACGAR